MKQNANILRIWEHIVTMHGVVILGCYSALGMHL